jgi:predicted TIM-barrel fold metal-dependent hydrolase
MYAADHVRRVLATFPEVFTGISEFTIHKEFVSSKIAGEAGSLTNPALDRLLDFAGEVGLIAIMHNDIVMPFTRRENERSYFEQMKQELRQHPNTTIIWAHTGLGRVVQPPSQHIEYLEEILSDPQLSHVYFDISWDEAGKYIVRDERTIETRANLINRYPYRFLMGTDWVAPETEEKYYSLYEMYQPLWRRLRARPETRREPVW